MGIDRERVIIQGDRYIAPQEIVTAPFTGATDWSCIHRNLQVERSGPELVVVYFRGHSGPTRDIPLEIHLELVNALFKALPELQVKTFFGNETFLEVQNMFANARVVVGPHGAGLVNVVFCQEGTPVVEFITEALFRPWQMFGGHTIGLPWWPVMLKSFNSRDEIVEAVSVVKEAVFLSGT